MRKNIKIAASFLRFQYYPHLLLTLLLCLYAGFVVSFRNLTAGQSAKVIEMYVIFVGILLLTPLFMPEQDKEIWRLTQTKKTPMWQTYVIRLVIAVLLCMGIVAVFLSIIKGSNSQVEFTKMWLGGISEVIFLGSIGYVVSGITNQVVLGYMAAVMYYAVNIGAHDKFKALGLFQMAAGTYDFTGWMLAAAGVLLVAAIVIREQRSRVRG